MAEQPDNIVLEHLRGLRRDIGDIKGDVQTLKAELQSQREEMATKSDLHSLRADVASDMLTMQKDTREQIVGLRRAVVEYHSAVVGHGLLISELEERVRRLEQHLKLPSLGRRLGAFRPFTETPAAAGPSPPSAPRIAASPAVSPRRGLEPDRAGRGPFRS